MVRLACKALLPMILLASCASQSLQDRAQAEHEEARRATAALLAERSLASQAGGAVRGGIADADQRAAEQQRSPVVRRSSRSWVASVAVPMGSTEALPSVFTESVTLNFDDAQAGGKVGLRVVAERITQLTGVPVRVKSDVFQGETASQALMSAQRQPLPPASRPLPTLPSGPLPTPSDAPVAVPPPREISVSAVQMKWSGSLEAYLNHLTDLLGLSWEYREGVVVIERFRTEFFEVALLEGESSYQLGLNGSDQNQSNSRDGANAQSNASADIKESGKADAMKSILGGVEQIIRAVPGSSVVHSAGSGRLAVTTTKETMTKVRQFVRSENESMLRQAQIQFDIYSVRRSETDEQGVDWNVVLNAVGKNLGGHAASPLSSVDGVAGQLGFSILQGLDSRTSRRWGGSEAVLKLLNEYGNATQHRPISLLGLNRQWVRKASLNNKAYVSETTPGAASALGAGAPGLKTSTVTTGDRYLAQAYILDNNHIVLKFAVGLSSLIEIVDFSSGVGANQQRVQTPETSAVIDQATVHLKAGQVLAITGLSRIVTTNKRRGLAEGVPEILGGSRTVQREREDFLILVRPTLL